jgi:L-amino acid N-acyltransferase YncA
MRLPVPAVTYLADGARGRGIGSRLAGLLVELFRFQGFQLIYSVMALPNRASERLSPRLGMKQVGLLPNAGYKLGSWHDVAQWDMEMNPATDVPEEAKSMAECAGSPEWDALIAAANSG